jgi:DNA-binding MarR family transcriptional regulator
MHTGRPAAPGYLANLMARLFHEVSGEGLAPLGIRPEQFPALVELWFGRGASQASLVDSLELEAAGVDALVSSLAADGLIEKVPVEASAQLVLTARGRDARDVAIAAARRANQAAAAALSEDEMAAFVATMNRVIDALKAAKS